MRTGRNGREHNDGGRRTQEEGANVYYTNLRKEACVHRVCCNSRFTVRARSARAE